MSSAPDTAVPGAAPVPPATVATTPTGTGAPDPLAIDRLVHEPARMGILSVLDGVTDAEFVFLQRALGLTKGNLSAHLSKLEAAGLVVSQKAFIERQPRTTLAITPLGRAARARHWAQLEALRGLGR